VSWRSVVVSRPAKLRREHYSLAIEQEQTAFVPFEDIAVIVLNHRDITLTHSVLAACGDYGIGLFSTGGTHHPNGVFLPFLSHSRATRWQRFQLALPKPVAKQAWASIVRRKVLNQAACLRISDAEGADRMALYAQKVRSGDNTRIEGQAAAFYFRSLFGKEFRRNLEGWQNSALDYGYAVMRGTIARALVAHGLLPSVGLFHASEQNAFNLADDLIEPFRPIVDLHVFSKGALDKCDLLPTDKTELIALLNVDVRMRVGVASALHAIDATVESAARMMEMHDPGLLELPELIGLRAHQREL
jgi:CRISPR-associated protein Cas1